MWIFTTDGFFSIVSPNSVKGAKTRVLVVRARKEEDLHRLLCHLEEFNDGKVINYEMTYGRDYLFRARVPRKLLQAYLKKYVTDLNYPNFKAEVERVDKQGVLGGELPATSVDDRMDAYHRVWSILRDWQDKLISLWG